MFIFCDSFDHYGSSSIPGSKWSSGGAIVTSPVRTGIHAFQGGATGCSHYPGTLTHFIVGFGLCFGGVTPSSAKLISFIDNSGGDSNITLWLSAASDGSLGLGCSWGYGAYGSSTYYGSTATGVIGDFTAYNYIEIEYLISATSGVINLWVDGVLRLTKTGNTVGPNSSAQVQLIQLTASGTAYYDDFYLLDCTVTPFTTPFGAGTRVFCCLPTADSGSQQWTPSVAGSHYPLVAAVPPDTTKWVSSATAGQIDEYLHTYAGIPGNAVVFAVQHCLNVELDATGAASVASCVGGVAAAAVALTGAGYACIMTPYAVNPTNGAGWYYSAVAGLGFGPKLAAWTSANARVTQSVVELLGGTASPIFQAMVLG